MLHQELTNTAVDLLPIDGDLIFSDACSISKTDSIFLSPPPPSVSAADYFERRMSTISATSDSSSRTGGDKRPLTPEDSPIVGSNGAAAVKRARAPLSLDASSDTPDGPRSSVHLPSINQTFDDYRFGAADRRMSLPTDVYAARSSYGSLPLQARPPYQGSSSVSPSPAYTFPPPSDGLNDHRPRLDTAVSSLDPNAYASPYPHTATTPNGTYYGTSPMTPDPAFGQSYNGTLRISGQDRRPSFADGADTGPKASWQFPSQDFSLPTPPPTMQLTPATSSPPTRSPVSGMSIHAPGSLVERPPRKRGKLPKHVTDYLKEWLHHHSDHPYPSEDEKKQLCHTTGLSMSQVSNWMINARRRILAPAQRAASAAAAAAATANPYQGRASTHSAHLIAAGRRASMPNTAAPENMHLHYPPSYASSAPGPYFTSGAAGPHRTGYLDPAAYGHRYSYSGVPSSGGAGHYLPSGMPSLSAPPPATPPTPYAGVPVYAQSPPTPSGKFYTGSAASDAQGGSTPGSNYDAQQ